MSRVLKSVKQFIEMLPPSITTPVKYIPYEARFGKFYAQMKEAVLKEVSEPGTWQADAVLRQVQSILLHSVQQIPMYKSIYRDWDIHSLRIHSLEHWASLPLVSKTLMQEWPLKERSRASRACLEVNTGGTTGQPLSFLVDKHAYAREWATHHVLWEKFVGYTPDSLKLTFRGRRLVGRATRFNPVHNEVVINSYAPFAQIADDLESVNERSVFLHGYPSLIYAFVRYLTINRVDLLAKLSGQIQGIIFASEYPAPLYRDYVEECLPKAKTWAFYGHSEMAGLAYEVAKNVYVPVQSYGYCEAVQTQENNGHRLVVTGLHNRVHPFVRYDTGDLIEPEFKQGMLRSFSIKEGRVGDFILDSNAQPISLTALIFGRHHDGFSRFSFVQVYQPRKGELTIILTGPPQNTATVNSLFDFRGVDIKVTFSFRETPVRTAAGKTPLLVSQKLWDEIELTRFRGHG